MTPGAVVAQGLGPPAAPAERGWVTLGAWGPEPPGTARPRRAAGWLWVWGRTFLLFAPCPAALAPRRASSAKPRAVPGRGNGLSSGFGD